MKPASTTLAEIRGGLLNEELSEAIRDVTAAVRETGRKGKVSVEITIEPFDVAPGEVERVTVRDKVAIKKPEKVKRASIFFIDSNHNLQRQQTIPGVEQPSASREDAKKAV